MVIVTLHKVRNLVEGENARTSASNEGGLLQVAAHEVNLPLRGGLGLRARFLGILT